jgi:outer membrane lipoprotein-sorting protein
MMTIFSTARRAILLLAATLALATATSAERYQPIQLSAAQVAEVQKINTYINSFQTMRGDFTQVSSRGQTSKGVMLISKPGKLRFEYAPPVPLLIVSDGKWLTIENTQRQRGDQFPLSATPLRFVVTPGVNLLQEADVVGFEQNEGLSSVAFQDKKGKMSGFITLIFDDRANVLQQWIITDAKGRRTTVQLANLEKGVTVDPKLFVVKINADKKN